MKKVENIAHINTTINIIYVLCLVMVAWGCTGNTDREHVFVFHDRLSQYGFFEGELSELRPAEGVLRYELNTPLFTDYAYKARFIKVPKGQSIEEKSGELIFPDGTVLIKNFYYHQDERSPEMGRRIIETRLLVKQDNRWKAGTYIWDDNQAEAFKEILGATKPVKWTDHQGISQKIDYVIPDNNDCKSCHKKGGEIVPIGPKIANLNKMIYTGKKPLNQLQYLSAKGIIKGLEQIDQMPRLPVWDDSTGYTLNERARAYLDVNCGHCHNAAGPANNTALFLEFEQQDRFKLGICKGPVSAAQGSGNLKYDIVPGDPEASILYYRMNSTAPGVIMPELGRTTIHSEGVELIKAWIENLEGEGCS